MSFASSLIGDLIVKSESEIFAIIWLYVFPYTRPAAFDMSGLINVSGILSKNGQVNQQASADKPVSSLLGLVFFFFFLTNFNNSVPEIASFIIMVLIEL